MTERKKRLSQSRGSTRATKAAVLTAVLTQQRAASPDESNSSTSPIVDTVPASSPGNSELSAAAELRGEIRQLRSQLAERSAAYRALVGKAAKSDSKVVAHVLRLLAASGGATKASLVAGTGAKKGYVDALLSRILPARGYTIISSSVDGSRVKSYHIASLQSDVTK